MAPGSETSVDLDGTPLAERIRRGDRSAENEFFVRYSGRVFAMGVARLKDREWARELADDVMLAVITALRRGTVLDTERLGAYVHGTTVNMINNQARARARGPRWAPIDEAVSTVDHADALERDSDLQRVRRCLACLSPHEQQILTLSLVEGLKPGEIAERLGMSSEVTRQHKSRALRRLKEKMDQASRNAVVVPLRRG